MKFLLPAAILLMSASSFAQSTHACNFEVYFAETSTGTSNVRNAPNGKVIVTLKTKKVAVAEGQPIPVITTKATVIGQNGEWFQISKLVKDDSAAGEHELPRFAKPAQDMAFVHKSIIAVRSKDSSVGIPVYVEPNAKEANVKSHAGLLTQNKEQKFTGCSGQYAQVAASNGAIGYVHSQFLSSDKSEVVEPAEVINGNQIMAFHPITGEYVEKKFADELASEVTPAE